MEHLRKGIKLISLIITFILLVSLLMPYNQIFANEETRGINDLINKVQIRSYSEEYVEWLELPEEERRNTIAPPMHEIEYIVPESNTLLRAATVIPAAYNLKNDVNITIKNQGNTNQCWAFAVISSLETNLAKTKGENYSFSPRHMDYATSKTFTDGVNEAGYNREVGDGGISSMALPYLTRGSGPVLEQDMPFANNEARYALSYIANKTAQKKVTEYVQFPNVKKGMGTTPDMTSFRENVKRHIMEYGSVTTGVLYSEEFISFNGTNLNVYCNDANAKPNHGVSIIGWDDNYPITNFKEGKRPQNPGAYIIRNSWDTAVYGSNYTGYDYISYEDVYIEYTLFGIVGVGNIDYDYIYQHDPLGCNEEMLIEGEKVLYGANVFTKSANQIQVLNEVSLAVGVSNINYEIYVNPVSGDLSSESLTKVATSSTALTPGYHTIKFNEVIYLTGEKFAVVVKYTCPNSNQAVIPIEYNDKVYWSTAKANLGESYVAVNLADNDWADLQEFKSAGIVDANICIKAFASNVSGEITLGSTVVTIKDAAGQPISGASITVYENNVKRNTVLTTNAQGEVTIDNMMEGKVYKIDVQKTGYIIQTGIQLGEITSAGQVLTKQVNLAQNAGGNNTSNQKDIPTDNTIYTGILPKTGDDIVFAGIIGILLMTAIIKFRKIKILKGI